VNHHLRYGNRRERRILTVIGGILIVGALCALGVQANQYDQEIAREKSGVSYYGISTESNMLTEKAQTFSPG